MTYVMKTMNGRWMLESKLCLKLWMTAPLNLRHYDVQKLISSLKLRKACGNDGIPNEFLRHLPRRQLVHLTHLFNHCFQFHFPPSWKEAKVITLLKLHKDPKFPQNLRLSTMGKLCVSVWLSCRSQHIASVHEAYRPCDPKFQ
jgi:hypothetical protein